MLGIFLFFTNYIATQLQRDFVTFGKAKIVNQNKSARLESFYGAIFFDTPTKLGTFNFFFVLLLLLRLTSSLTQEQNKRFHL